MALPILGDLIGAGIKIVDKLIPDPAAKAQAQLAILQLQQASEFKAIESQLQMAQMQASINEKEAANPNIFVSGWRPAVGWVCVLALASNYFFVPALSYIAQANGLPPLDRLDLSELVPLLVGMLGLGGLRTVEKLGARKD